MTDINIWLVTFGFHLHNAIPGFPIPKFDLTQPSLEMKKSQLWDDLPVRIPTPQALAWLTTLCVCVCVWVVCVCVCVYMCLCVCVCCMLSLCVCLLQWLRDRGRVE